jgi:hypothetical protein
MRAGKGAQMPRDDPASQAFRHADPHPAQDIFARGRLDGAGRQGHALHRHQQRLARIGQLLPLAGLFEQCGAKARFKAAQATAHSGGIHPAGLRRAGQLAVAGNGKEGLIVAPVGRLHNCSPYSRNCRLSASLIARNLPETTELRRGSCVSSTI